MIRRWLTKRWLATLFFASSIALVKGFVPTTVPCPATQGVQRRTLASTKSTIARRQHNTIVLRSNVSNNNNTPGGGANDMDPGLKLLICILIDLIGVASFAAPGLGEATDIGWAPISAFLVNYLFGNGVFTALALVEELLPGFDIIPTATIAWFVENANREDITPTDTDVSSTSSESENRPVPSKRTEVPPTDVIDVEVMK